MEIIEVQASNFQQFQTILNISGNPMEEWDQFAQDPFRHCYLLKKDGIICAYIDFSMIYERAELNQIFVIESYRKQHCASQLMDFMIEQCMNQHCCNVTLEVRESNIAAQKLYQKYQFQSVAKRERYYQIEDAILMERTL